MFHLNGINITINDCYKMNFNDVIKCFQKDGYFFSTEFIKKNLHIMKSGVEVLHEGYQFYGVLYRDKVEVHMDGNFVKFEFLN